MLPKIDTSITNTGGLTNRDKSFLDRLKTQGYSESSRYDLLNKARQQNGLPTLPTPSGEKGFIGAMTQQAGEIGSQIVQGVKNIPKEEGFIRKTFGDFQERAENINKNDTMKMGDRRTTRNLGQLLGAANDLFGNAVGSGIQTFVPKSLRSSAKDIANLGLKTAPGEATKDVAIKAYEQWKQFERTNPELAKDLGAVGNIANFALNFVGGGQASKIKPTGMIDDAFSRARGVVDDATGKVSPTIKKFASNVPENVSNLSTGAAEVGVSAASGVSREAQQIIKQQPGLYQQARQGAITREAVTDDVVSALGKRMDDISELGKGYETIRTSSVKVPKSDIANITKQHLDELKVSKIDLPLGDRTTVQKALDYIAEYPDTLSAQNALSLRRKFDDLINWKSEATGEGKRIIRGLRTKIDNYLGEKIPGLKTLDKQYGPEREFIDKVRTSILDKQGNLKDNAISTVANMVGKGKELKLDRFEKLLPGIGDKVRALKAFEEIQNLAQIKTGSVARQIFSFAVGGIPGFVATNPYVVGYALEKYGFAKQAIKALLAKGKNISKAEQNTVKKAVQGMTKKEAEKVIASKVGTPLLTSGKVSIATGNTGGKLPPVDLTPPSSTGNGVSSQSRIGPPQTAGLLDSPKKTISDTAKQTIKPVVKSPGKKVNTPIISKKEVKANLPTRKEGDYMVFEDGKLTKTLPKKTVETPKVEGKTAKAISSEEKSIMESAPQPIKGVEVPDDYFPTDGLPTGTEFESAVLPKTKTNKIPSPDIKRPQIRGIDLGIRSNMIDSLGEQGIFTDAFFAITDKPLATKFIDYAKTKAIKKGQPLTGKSPDIKSLMKTARRSADTTLTPQEYVKGLDGDKAIYLRFDLGDGNKVAVNSSYTDIFFKNFDDVTFKGSNEVSPVVVYSKGRDVGVIMPIKDPYGSKEVLGDFTTVSKPKSSLPLSQKSEVKYSKKDIADGKYNPKDIYKDYTENYMHSDKWKGKSKAIVIDSDSIKKMFNEYDPKNPGLVHEESSNLSKEFFDRAVAENPDAPVIFSAGGPASGKSEGIINGYHGEKNVIFDTVLGDFEAFLKKAKSKIKDGKVKVHAIYTDIDTAKKYNAGRDRSVPESLLESKHKGFRKAMDDLIKSKEYKEGKIAVEIRANKGGFIEQIPTNGIEDFIREHKNRLDIK